MRISVFCISLLAVLAFASGCNRQAKIQEEVERQLAEREMAAERAALEAERAALEEAKRAAAQAQAPAPQAQAQQPAAPAPPISQPVAPPTVREVPVVKPETIPEIAPPAQTLADRLVGSWTGSRYISAAEYARLSKSPMPEGMSIELTASFGQNYHRGGSGDSDGEMTMKIRRGTEELPLKFRTKGSATWLVEQNVLSETTVDGVYTPADALTKSFIDQNPQMMESIRPIKGKTNRMRIVSITDDAVELEMEENQMRYTLRRKKDG